MKTAQIIFSLRRDIRTDCLKVLEKLVPSGQCSMLKNLVLAVFLFGLTISEIAAQDLATVDSLQAVLKSDVADTFKVKAYIGLASEFISDSPSVAMGYCEQSLHLSESIQFPSGVGEAAGWLAYLYEQQGEIELAIRYNQEALVNAQKCHDHQGEATILGNLAAIYKDRGEIHKALSLNAQSLEIKIRTGDLHGISVTLNNVGLIFASQGRVKEALDNYWKAVKIDEYLKDYGGVSIDFSNIAYVYKDQKEYDEASKYFHKVLQMEQAFGTKFQTGYTLNALGQLFADQGNGDSAFYYFQKALNLRTAINDQVGMAYTLLNIGGQYENLGNLNEAQTAYASSLRQFQETGVALGEARTTNKLGGILLKQNKLAQAESYLLRSLEIARELGFPNDQCNAAQNLLALYRNQKDSKRALEMADIYYGMRDSVANIENKKAAIKSGFRYEFEKRELAIKAEQAKRDMLAANEIAKQKLLRNGFLVGFAVMVFFAAIFFLQRNRIAKEKKRSEELLLNILPKEVAEELKAKGSAQARQIDQVTVLFTDFKGFTQLSEALSPQELVAEIHFCFSEFDRIMQKYGVEKIKTIGDAYMAAGGLPTPNTSNALDVVRAALEVQAFINTRKKSLGNAKKPIWEMRIGIHTGPVVAGIVGIKKFQYDIWGDTVNIASRMETSCEVGRINISGSTYQHVKDSFPCTFRGKIAAKGKGDIDMYFLDEKSAMDTPR